MSQRERLASGTVSEPASRPAGGHPAVVRPQPAATTSPPLNWEDYFRAASPARQKELLALAARQGIVYAQQLVPHSNGAADPDRQLLSHLLGGRLDDLETPTAVQVSWLDPDLDEDQRDAVGKALGTPDYCLIQGLPGSGKTRVITELAAQAVQRGQRVLLLSFTSAALDGVLERIGTRDTIAPIRCVGRDERPESLPPAVRELTCAARLRCFHEQALPAAQRQVVEAEERCRRRALDEPVLAGLVDLAERCERLAASLAEGQREREQVPGEVERQAQAGEADAALAGDSVFGTALLQAVAERKRAASRIEQAQAESRLRAVEQEKAADEVQQQLASLVPFAQAKQQGRWWSWSWWQAASQGDVVGKLTELETRKQQLAKDLAELAEADRQLADESAAVERSFATQRAAFCQAECERRQQELDARLRLLQDERAQLEEQWREQERSLDPATPRPREQSAAAVQAAQSACRQQRELEQRQAAFAHEWAETLVLQAPTFGQQLVRQANLVAAPVAALAADPQFGDASGQSFDLLILDEAHLIVEAEWLPLARRARRWVLVGEPAWDRKDSAAADTDRTSPPRRDLARPPGRGLSSARVTPAVPRLFPRLWRQLHADPRRLPYAWFQEDGRWCCRLRELTAEQRTKLESECVADRPDIELRIFAEPRLAPVLAEVAFPASMSIPQAKEFIYRELQELPVQALGSRIHWSEEAGRLVLRLSDIDCSGVEAIDLEPGVREVVNLPGGGTNGHASQRGPTCTHCLEFDGASGWDRLRAEDWVRDHLGIRDLGRTAQLVVPHRMHPELAAFVSHLLFEGAYRLARQAPAPEHLLGGRPAPPVEFVSVTGDAEPAARLGEAARGKPENGRRGGPVVRARPTARGGAGLETDLNDPRYRERLPAAARGDLPAHGFANYAEAQAVVRTLENMARQPESNRWHVGVSALYPAQVQLIRNLVCQSAALKDAPFKLLIDEPWAFRSRECQVMLLSLTRSHSHRAVTFGEGPHLFALALTRARAKLVLFGDLGTLQRRCQWDGPVDHLDADAASREREFLQRLLQSLPGDGAQPRSWQPREGQCS